MLDQELPIGTLPRHGRGTSRPAPADLPPVFGVFNLPLQIARTHDGLWALMRKLGEFTASEIIRRCEPNIEREAISDYVRALHRGGFLASDLSIGDAIYRIARRQIEAPRLKADGTLLVTPHRQANLWRTMKMLGMFNAEDLALAASLPELPIAEEQAARYAGDLAAAGYLMERGAHLGPPLWRFKRSMNTGPAAPQILRARFIWDPNNCRIMGEATAVDEVRS